MTVWQEILCALNQASRRTGRITRHIVHPAQTQQDALNEFAAELVNPPKRYLAHIRMPQRYHTTRLNPPVIGEINAERIAAVRRRSQRMYRIGPDDEYGAAAPSTPRTSPSSPGFGGQRIRRRPRSEDPDQETLPYPIERED
jgi:hypothetical protein